MHIIVTALQQKEMLKPKPFYSCSSCFAVKIALFVVHCYILLLRMSKPDFFRGNKGFRIIFRIFFLFSFDFPEILLEPD